METTISPQTITAQVMEAVQKEQLTQQEIVFPQPAKVQEVILPKKKGGLITKEMFEYNLNHPHFYSSGLSHSGVLKTVKFKNSDYYPFYTLGFSPDMYLDQANLLQGNFEFTDYEKLYGGSNWKANVIYTKFLQACLGKGYYNILLFLNHGLCQSITQSDELRKWFMKRFESFIRDPYEAVLRTTYRSVTGAMSEAFDVCRMINDWVVYRPRRNSKETIHKAYLSNMYFMAELPEADLSNLSNANIRPLFCLVAKKEHLPLLRAYFISNTPIPSGMLELWVDNSLEAEGNKMKPVFRKYIKNKFMAAGVAIKYFDDLKAEVLEEFKTPNFNTLQERSQWTEGILEQWYDTLEGKCRYTKVLDGIVTDEKVAAVLKVFEAELKDVEATIS